MEAVKLLNIKVPILQTKALSNGDLAIVDAQTTVRIISMQDNYKVIGGFKSSIHHERVSGPIVDVAFQGDYSISVVPKSNQAAAF